MSTRLGRPFAAALLTLLLLAPSAAAHAKLDVVTPRDGAQLDAPPARIVIEFTADVEDAVEEVVLLGPGGSKESDSWSATGTAISVEVPETMAPGAWAVRWRVTGGDGHPITGSSRFTIGAAAEPSADHDAPPTGHGHAAHAGSSYPHDEIGRIAIAGRVLFFGGLLLFVGGVVFAVWAAPGWQPRFRRASLLATLLGAWIVLGAHVAMVDERSVLELLDPRGWLVELGSVGVRGYVLAAVLVLVANALRGSLEPSAWERRRGSPPRAVVAAVLGAAAAPSLSGHAVDGEALWLRVPLDMLHVLAGAAWLGGLVQLLTITVSRRALDPRMYPVVDRYSRIAGVSVVVLVLSGAYATIDELGAGLGALFGSTWGRLVLLKLGLLVASLPLANANRLRNVPGVSTDPRRNLPRLRRFVALELFIVGWVIVATAFLVYQTPPT